MNNPWVIDTAASITTDMVRINVIRWVGATTAGHTVTIKDTASTAHTIWAGVATAANSGVPESSLSAGVAPGFNARGFNVTSIQSGTLYVYYL